MKERLKGKIFKDVKRSPVYQAPMGPLTPSEKNMADELVEHFRRYSDLEDDFDSYYNNPLEQRARDVEDVIEFNYNVWRNVY